MFSKEYYISSTKDITKMIIKELNLPEISLKDSQLEIIATQMIELDQRHKKNIVNQLTNSILLCLGVDSKIDKK